MTHKSKTPPLSLAPLSFDEAVTDILKIKPEPKKKPKGSKRENSVRHEQERRRRIMTYDNGGKRYERMKSFPTHNTASAFLLKQKKSGKDVAMWSEQNGQFAVGKAVN